MPEKRMPVVFFGHGSPTIARETNDTTRTWRAIAESVPRPRAILAVSAHWLTRGVAVTAMEEPLTIHDFGQGLGSDLFRIQYPAPGAPALAERVRDLLAPSIDVGLDHKWGLDHGTWSVLMKAFPDADIPVVQLSMDATKEPAWHLSVGRRLQPLRDEGVLIIGTGNIVHNLGVMEWNEQAKPYDWATRFNDYVKTCVTERNMDGLSNYLSAGEDAIRSVPSNDHYLPLLYAVGAAGDDYEAEFNPDFIIYKSLSMTSIRFQ